MRAFITGASGFIGGHLSAHLVQNEWHVRALVHSRKITGPDNIETVQGDIRNEKLIKDALRDVDVVFHLASALGAAQIKKKEFFEVNAQGTRTVLEAGLAAGIKRVVHYSSAGVLGHVEPGLVADENYPLDPQDIYDQSKLEGENIALDFARRGLDVVIIRPGWVYGPGDRRTFKLVRSIERRRFILVSKGRTLQTPVYIADLIQGTMLCTEKGRRGEIYNLAGPEVLTVKQIAETIASVCGKKIPRPELPLLPVKAAAWMLGKSFSFFRKEAPLTPARLSFFIHPKPLSIRKAAGLGFLPETDFRNGMEQTVAWYREAGWL
jgi:dihydroflavonol-4-reductase